jgi:DNA-binding transcriptional MocR family regulator
MAGQPVYLHIASSIRESIRTGELRAGDRLPPIRALAGELEVNRDTVAVAYERLAGEGWVESAVGRGTFVLARLPLSPRRAPLVLSSQVERLLAFENARPRFGSAADAVPLHSLIPDPAFYPVDEFRRAFNRVLQRDGPELFLYAGPQGHAGLRAVLAERFASDGIQIDADGIVLCHGASQGIALTLRLFAQAGDAIAVEEPTYHNVLATLVALGVHAEPVAMREDGPDLAQLESVLGRPEVKAFYTIPSFHNPLGTTSALGHRRQQLEIAARCGVPIIEDGFETDLRCSGRPVPPLAALDREGWVVHLSSFSKSLFPGVRVGSIAARGRVVDGLLALKHATDLSDSLPLQAALAEFLQTGAYDRHLTRMRKRLRARRDAALAALAAHMPDGARWTEPEGGYQIWLDLPGSLDTRDLLADAARAGVLFVPGSQFRVDGGASSGMRLTLARANEEEIARGIERLAGVIRERLATEPVARQSADVHL